MTNLIKLSQLPTGSLYATTDYIPVVRDNGDTTFSNYRIVAQQFQESLTSSSYSATASYATSSSYSATASYAMNGGSGGASVIISDTQPTGSIVLGTLWWNSSYGSMKIYYTDISGSQWVDASSTVGASQQLISQSISSSYATTASYAMNGGSLVSPYNSLTKIVFDPDGGITIKSPARISIINTTSNIGVDY